MLKNYEYFLMLVEEKSISKSAERLYISQPSLSKYLKKLEENLGQELFSRENYPLKLTKAGEIYLRYVEESAKREKKLREELSNLISENIGDVSMGITVWRSSVLLPLILPKFKEKYPLIDINIYEGSHQHMASLLKADKIDFAISHIPNQYMNFIFEHLQFELILFCVNKNNPKLLEINFENNTDKLYHLSFEEFKLFEEEDFILLKQGQNIREITQNFLNKLEIEPKIILETGNIVTAMNMVQNGMGVTFVPGDTRNHLEQFGNLIFFVVDNPPLHWEVGLGYKNASNISSQARLLINFIKKNYSIKNEFDRI